MEIVVDCRSVHQRMGGIGRAALELVRAMSDLSEGHRISMIIGAEAAREVSVDGVRTIPVDAAMIDEAFEQLHLPALLEELRADVYLNSTFSIPAIKTVSGQCAFIHDVVFEDCPEYVEPGLRKYLSKWSRFTAFHADLVLTGSDHAKSRISKVYDVNPETIVRVYHGIAPSCFEQPSQHEVARVRDRYALRGPYLLYLGSVEPKKGIPELLKAFEGLSRKEFDGELVLAGGTEGPPIDWDAQIRATRCSGRIKRLGYIDEADKRALLAASALFVYPSRYEGFGLPPLEAMALGIPCVVSNQTSLPEVVGNAAIITDTSVVSEFTSALVKGFHDDQCRSQCRRAGPERAREFTWERAAAQAIQVCERLGAA